MIRPSRPFLLGLVAAVLTPIFLSGCATIFNGTDQDVRFKSEPSNAEIIIGGATRGTTPATLTLTKPGLEEKRITFEKQGYKEKSVVLQKEFAKASILNVFGPTLVGFGVDALSGALFNYSPAHYTVELEREGESVESRSPHSTQWYSLRELETNDQGHVLIPNGDRPVHVFDTETGALYIFR